MKILAVRYRFLSDSQYFILRKMKPNSVRVHIDKKWADRIWMNGRKKFTKEITE